MQNIFLCDKIEIAPFSTVKSIDNDEVTFMNDIFNFSEIENITSAAFTEQGQEADAGTLAIQTLDLKLQTPIGTFILLIEQPYIFRIRFSDGRVKIWGSLTNLIQKTATKRESDATQITFVRKSIDFEF